MKCNSLPRRVSRGGAQGAWAPPPRNWKAKKKKKKVIRANFKLFHLYFATFSVENVIFSAISELGPPPLKNWKAKKKKKKKKRFQILGPPSYEFLDTRLLPDLWYNQMLLNFVFF